LDNQQINHIKFKGKRNPFLFLEKVKSIGMDLSKSDKKVARELIEKGLETEFEEGLSEFADIIADWQSGKTSIKDSYYGLFKSVAEFDKHIGRRYDRMTGSNYFWIVLQLFVDKKIPLSEMDRFAPDVQMRFRFLMDKHED
jgi:hypothetical protein